MSRIRILHLITSSSTGGAERTLQRLVTGMNRDEFDNSVISLMDEGEVAPLIRASGISVRSLGMRRGVPAPGALLRMRSILKRERPAILQTWLYHADLLGLVASRLAPVPRLVWNLRCSEMDLRHYSIGSRATRRALAFTSRIPDVVVVNSRAGLTAHERYGYSPRRWELIPNGLDPEVFLRDEEGAQSLRETLGVPHEAAVIGTLGRFDAMKDYATFLAAAAEVRTRHASLRVLMAGRGMDVSNGELMRMITDSGLSSIVTLLGERSDVPRVLSALDVYCLSSAFGEGFPNAVAEAMACEVPVVVTDVGDAAWITGVDGISPRDPASLASRISELLDLSPAARRAHGAAHRERVEREFGLRRMIGAYESLYRELSLGLTSA